MSAMTVALKNGFVHVAETSTSLRRTKSCEIAALALYNMAPLSIKKCQLKEQASMGLASTDAGSDTQSSVGEPTFGTSRNCVVFRNFPSSMTQRRFVNALRQAGFDACFDTVHLPLNTQTWMPKGFAFVRFLDDDFAQQAIEHFNCTTPFGSSSKPLRVEVAKHSLKVKNLVAAADSDASCPPEMYPMIFDTETGKELRLPTKASRSWSSTVADRA